jgi:acyl carrier protein
VDLGADSLKIVRLVVDVQRGFSVKLPVKQMNARELSARSLARYVEASAATRSRV